MVGVAGQRRQTQAGVVGLEAAAQRPDPYRPWPLRAYEARASKQHEHDSRQ